MQPRVRELRMEDLDALPGSCRGCMFWQSNAGGRGGVPSDPAAQDAWWRAVQLEWGVPGRGIWRDDGLVAFALFAPPLHVQRVRTMGPPPGEGVVVLATIWVHPDHRGGGLARHLVQVVARDAVVHGHRAIEAWADPGGGTGACAVTGAFLERVGFVLHRADRRHPLYRLDLARTARWQSSVGSALGDVVAALSRRERNPSRPAIESRGLKPGVWRKMH
ncbi:hypothetical protein BH23ACT9_BH23ACT9_25220 [soil metagenome]